MTSQQLQQALRAMGVTVPKRAAPGSNDWMRASIYLAELRAAQTFFQTNNAGIVGPNVAYVRKALRDPELLSELAQALDFFAAPAFEVAMANAAVNPATVANYFNTHIFHANPLTFQANVTAFRNACPIANAAITQIAANFQQNIQTMCQRLIADRNQIEDLFEPPGVIVSLSSLDKIEPTGSDFHKGGQQVLILTFSMNRFNNCVCIKKPFKLVYKPGDLEADCLMVGDSAAVNRADPGFMVNSLFEIFNAAIAPYITANGATPLRPLPTYKILPRNYLSANNPVPAPVPVRQAYGYIEYLTYDGPAESNVFTYYPFGSSDFLIFRTQDAAPIIETFYRQMGHFIAIAATFSIQDMHQENVRVRSYTVHPIDLEISLTRADANVGTTELFGQFGAINTDQIAGQENWFRFVEHPLVQPVLAPVPVIKFGQNRLYAQRPGRRLVPPNAFWLLQGLSDGMDLLRFIQANNGLNNGFTAWFNRLTRVLVRSIPYATEFWTTARQEIFRDTVMVAGTYGDALLATIQTALTIRDNAEGDAYANALNVVPPPVVNPIPKFVVLHAPQTATDLVHLDVPSYYHVIGTDQIVDSNGGLIAVANNVALPNGHNVPIGRTTYYPTPPTLNAVDIAQVQALTGGGFAARVNALEQQVLNRLQLGVAPLNPGVLIP